MPDLTPGFYWIKTDQGWEPAEWTGDNWCILMLGLEPGTKLNEDQIGPEIVAPPGLKPSTDYWRDLPA